MKRIFIISAGIIGILIGMAFVMPAVAQYRQFILHFKIAQTKPPLIMGALSIAGQGKEWTVMCNGARAELPAITANLGARIVDEHAPSLNEIFVARASAVAPDAS